MIVKMRQQVTLELARKERGIKRQGRLVRRESVGLAWGTVDPAIPGRVLLLPVNGIFPVAKTTVRNGRYSIRSNRIRRGRYQAVFIPEKSRAERATSKTGKLK